MNEYTQNLLKACEILGGYEAVGRVCGGISGKAVSKWKKNGKPPRTEYSGETRYAQLISQATGGKVRVNDLLPFVSVGVESKINAA